MIFEDYDFHDAIISDIWWDKNYLYIDISNEWSEIAPFRGVLKAQIEQLGLYPFYTKRYSFFSKVKYRLKEIKICHITKLFSSGKRLQVDDVYVSLCSDTFIISCVVIPYPNKRGVEEKITLALRDCSEISIQNSELF